MEDLPIITREDIRRLEKAAREKDKKHLKEFLAQYENQVADAYIKEMQRKYVKMTEDFADSFLTVLMYCATLSEDCKVDKDNIQGFIKDVNVTFEMLGKGEIGEEEMKKALSDEGVTLSDRIVDPFSLIRDELTRLDNLFTKYDDLIDQLHKGMVKYNLI